MEAMGQYKYRLMLILHCLDMKCGVLILKEMGTQVCVYVVLKLVTLAVVKPGRLLAEAELYRFSDILQ